MKFSNLLSILCFFVFALGSVAGVEYTVSSSGYHNPDGYVKICSWLWKPTKITQRSLKKLFLSVMDKNGLVTPYNYYNVTSLMQHPDIDVNKKTFVWVGSYMDVSSYGLGEGMGKQYLNLGYNVLLLHYMDVHWKNYIPPTAARLMRPLGKYAAEMLANLTMLGLDSNKLELVGYGLGGQAMSFVAKNYREITGRNISMLVGLDPAGPCFRTLGPDQRLDPSDADFVLSVATNIDGLGIATPVGHITFYVNGGEYQFLDIWFLPCDIECSHLKAHLMWLTALFNPGTFIGMKCDTIQDARQHKCYDRKPMVTNTMDLGVDKSKQGIYYLSTNFKYPYGLGKAGLRRSGSPITKQFISVNAEDVMIVK